MKIPTSSLPTVAQRVRRDHGSRGEPEPKAEPELVAHLVKLRVEPNRRAGGENGSTGQTPKFTER